MPVLRNNATFRKAIISPIYSGSKSRFQNLQKLLQTICIRRTRQLLSLPEPIEDPKHLDLTAEERAEYQDLLRRCKLDIDNAANGRRKNKIKSAMLESLLKLRLFCNNGSARFVLQMGPNGLPTDSDLALSYLQQQGQNHCAHCGGEIYSISDVDDADGGIFVPHCCHMVCYNCIPHHHTQKQKCVSCAAGIEPLSMTSMPSETTPGPVREEGNEVHRHPSKLLQLLQDLRRDPTQKRSVLTLYLYEFLYLNIYLQHCLFLLEKDPDPCEADATDAWYNNPHYRWIEVSSCTSEHLGGLSL
jgi:hypothetical protein